VADIEVESTMPKKFKPISTVPFNLIIKGHKQITADHEEYGSAEPTISLVRALAADHKPEEMLAVSYRLGALAKLIKAGGGKPWTFRRHQRQPSGRRRNDPL
jgi:hypothetical protein